MRHAIPTLVVLFTAVAPVLARARAQDTLSLIGQRVVIRYRRPLTIGGVSIEPKDYRAYKVERADGDMLWLVSGGFAGWIPKDQVMTLDEALAFYTQDIRQNPLAWNSFLYRGFVWDMKHEFDRAIADYTEAIRIYPLWANTYNNRGWTYHRTKEYDRAIADYNAAIKLDPQCVLAIVNRGFAWQDKGEYYKAITDFNRAIKVDPSYSRAHLALGWLYATCPDKKFRDGKLAIKSTTRACDLTKWKEAAKLAGLAAAYAESGDFEKAVRWQQHANDGYFDAEDRRKGLERLALYRQKKPYRFSIEAGQVHHHGTTLEDANPFATFHDPVLAARVFGELEERVGPIPDDADDQAREAHDRKLASAVGHFARKYHLKQRDVRAIWHAGTGTKPPASH